MLYEAEDMAEIEAYLFGADALYKPEAPQVQSFCQQPLSHCAPESSSGSPMAGDIMA